MAAQPYIAQWVGEHPKWNAVRWRCEYPHTNDKADAGGGHARGLNRSEDAVARLLVAVLQILVGDRKHGVALISMSAHKALP
jgi:hypothetical protein